MHYSLEYSQIVRRKLRDLKKRLSKEKGEEFALRFIKKITDVGRILEISPDVGVSLSSMYEIETDYRYFFVNHYYLFYYTDGNKLIIAEIFNEHEDFLLRLFGISGRTEESIDYWGE